MFTHIGHNSGDVDGSVRTDDAGRLGHHALGHDELDVGAVQLQEPGPYHLMGEVRPGDPGGLAFGADRFHDQFHDLVQILPVGGKPGRW